MMLWQHRVMRDSILASIILLAAACGGSKHATDQPAATSNEASPATGSANTGPASADTPAAGQGAAEGKPCAGIAGIQCAAGLTCKVTEKHPDAMGTCVKP